MAKALVFVNIPNGYELASESMRSPVEGEYYWCPHWGSGPRQAECAYGFDAIILRPAWTWPAWLRAPWIAMEKDGEWVAFNCEPIINVHYWGYSTHHKGQVSQGLHPSLCDFTGPPCTDWRESKRKNPNL
jgi:hypothetical protein